MVPTEHAATFRYADCVQCGQVVRCQKQPNEVTSAASSSGIGYAGECPACRVQVFILVATSDEELAQLLVDIVRRRGRPDAEERRDVAGRGMKPKRRQSR